jgi:periplasmic copper chaperone A
MRTSRRVIGVAVAAAGTVLAFAAPAAAHVEPDPSRIKPGKDARVTFTAEHGCEDSPTTGMTFRIPKNVTNAAPVEKDGFTASTTKRTIEFTGGSIPGDEEAPFTVTFKAPDEKTEIVWKVIQRCGEGTERWIESDPDGDFPAPRVGVGQKPTTGHEEEEDEH